MTEFLCKSHYVNSAFSVARMRCGERLIALLKSVSMLETILKVLSLLGKLYNLLFSGQNFLFGAISTI